MKKQLDKVTEQVLIFFQGEFFLQSKHIKLSTKSEKKKNGQKKKVVFLENAQKRVQNKRVYWCFEISFEFVFSVQFSWRTSSKSSSRLDFLKYFCICSKDTNSKALRTSIHKGREMFLWLLRKFLI